MTNEYGEEDVAALRADFDALKASVGRVVEGLAGRGPWMRSLAEDVKAGLWRTAFFDADIDVQLGAPGYDVWVTFKTAFASTLEQAKAEERVRETVDASLVRKLKVASVVTVRVKT